MRHTFACLRVSRRVGKVNGKVLKLLVVSYFEVVIFINVGEFWGMIYKDTRFLNFLRVGKVYEKPKA
jgi:hypothetical protein